MVFLGFLLLSSICVAQSEPQQSQQELSQLKEEVQKLKQEVESLRGLVGREIDLSKIAGNLTGAAQLFDRRDNDLRNRLILLEQWHVALEASLSPLMIIPDTPAKRDGAKRERYELIAYLRAVVKRLEAEKGTEKARAELNGLMARLFGEIQKIEME